MPQERKFYPIDKKTIIITGGAGFLGSHLCDELVKENNIICIDNFVGNTYVSNIKHLLQNPSFRLLKHDINEKLNFSEFKELDDLKIDVHGISEIYHLACPTSAKHFDKLRMQTLHTNSIGTINMLEIAKEYKAKILLASSAVVYGPRRPDNPFFKETDFGAVDFISPRACYDEGKRFSETAMITYKEMYNVDTKIVRIFRTYGSKQPLFDGQMIPDFVLQSLNHKPLVIYGDKNFTTSLCYVDDIIEAILKTMESNESGPINLGGTEEYNLAELCKKIINITESKSEIKFEQPLRFMSPLGLPDITLAKQKIDWFPITSIDDGLRKLIDYLKANKLLLQPLISKYEEKI